MFKYSLFLPVLALFLNACATTTPPKRTCPIGGTTEISTSANTGKEAEKMAMKMAAEATLRDGYERFSVTRQATQGNSHWVQVKMYRVGEETTLQPSWVARGTGLNNR